MRAFNAILATKWAITEDALRLMLALANRENELTPEAVNAVLSPPLEKAQITTVRNGVAILPIEGPIFRHASIFGSISGATSVEVIARDFKVAMDDPAVHSILLSVDSPGGEVNGIDELSQLIFDARGTKPIHAHISGDGASAAYWLASAADTLTASRTAHVGSIGVVAALPDPKATKSDQVEFVSSQSPNKRPDISTEEGRSQIQDMVDSLAQVFVTTVARNRGVSAETVLSDFGAGSVLIGQAAKEAGLVDNVGSFEKAIDALSENKGMLKTMRSSVMSFKDKILAAIQAVPEEEAVSVNPNQPATEIPATVPVATPTTPAAVPVADDEVSRLRADNARLLRQRFEAEAATFATTALTEGRAFPAEREALISFFVQASMDDNVLGGLPNGGSRVALLKGLIAARPQHQLTAESLTPALAKILQSQADATTDPHAEAVSEDDVEKLLSKTAFGATVLRELKGIPA